ncbi:hypothetical protein [Campylobacter troglodytis]|uniref:hypothetical protein n=1 Tax=Campylobacter troglodytis TaxID=654363 RepID=UPI001159634D|nr:hypothetical protein [Campylobacter troglodytis]TQR60368.1 hypothetical protein DMC01_06070 [Campylobacter troglodytis]
MQRKKAFCFIIILVNIIIYLSLNLYKNTLNLPFFLSYEFAFFMTLCIILLSFLSYQKNILNKAKTYKFEERPNFLLLKAVSKNSRISKFRIIKDEFKPSFKVALKNFRVFFNLAKLFAYCLFVLGFLILKRWDLLDIFAFIAGISSLVLTVFIFAFWMRNDKF